MDRNDQQNRVRSPGHRRFLAGDEARSVFGRRHRAGGTPPDYKALALRWHRSEEAHDVELRTDGDRRDGRRGSPYHRTIDRGDHLPRVGGAAHDPGSDRVLGAAHAERHAAVPGDGRPACGLAAAAGRRRDDGSLTRSSSRSTSRRSSVCLFRVGAPGATRTHTGRILSRLCRATRASDQRCNHRGVSSRLKNHGVSPGFMDKFMDKPVQRGRAHVACSCRCSDPWAGQLTPAASLGGEDGWVAVLRKSCLRACGLAEGPCQSVRGAMSARRPRASIHRQALRPRTRWLRVAW